MSLILVHRPVVQAALAEASEQEFLWMTLPG